MPKKKDDKKREIDVEKELNKAGKKAANKAKRKAKKAAKKAAKKHPVIFTLCIVAVLAIGVGGYFAYQYWKSQNPEMSLTLNGPSSYSVPLNSVYEEKGATAMYGDKDVSDKIVTTYSKDNAEVFTVDTSVEGVYKVTYAINYEKLVKSVERSVTVTKTDSANISIHFLELGNKYTGDSVYIKAGETDILIDAGSRQGSAEAIGNFLRKEGNVSDNKLEYVVATHAHQDHIAGFVGTAKAPGIFEQFDVGTIIDFPLTEATTSIYTRYQEERAKEIAAGAQHFTALECVKESKPGAQKVYTLAPGITMEVLYQKYYEENAKGNENEYSVCLLFTHGTNHYLFTGDLEEHGEASLIASNNLPEVVLFKGAHHGSYTANSDALLSVIKPQIICICCCAGTTEFRPTVGNEFPAQRAIDRMGKYTEKIYVTSLWKPEDPNGFVSMNGTITCTSAGVGMEVHGSNNDIILKDTEWFKANRTWPSRPTA